MTLSSSLEDYLEAILNIYNSNGIVRVTDIGETLKVEKSSVNTAVKKLQNYDFVVHKHYGEVFLTEEGKREAERIKKKHTLLAHFFKDFLRLSSEESERDACKIEHVISEHTFDHLVAFMDFLEKPVPAGSMYCQQAFHDFLIKEKGMNDGNDT